MGTFRLLPQNVVQNGAWAHEGGGVTDISILSGLGGRLNQSPGIGQARCDASGPPIPFYFVNGFVGPGTWELDCSLSTIELDGVPGVHINNLPIGFNILSLNFNADFFDIHNGVVDGGQNCISALKLLYDGAIEYDNPNATTNHNIVQSINVLGISALTLFGGHWVFRSTFSANNIAATACGNLSYASAYAKLAKFILVGSYNVLQSPFPFLLNNPTTTVNIGDKVKITSITGGLDAVTEIDLSFIDPVKGNQTLSIDTLTGNVTFPDGTVLIGSYPIIIQQADILWFYLPFGFGVFSGLVSITLIGDGVQFSGSIMIGALTLLYENTTGIYNLVDDQTDDILYTRNGFITDTNLIMLPDMRDDEVYNEFDTFFDLLGYPQRVLAQDDLDENYEQNDFSEISIIRQVVSTETVEIPSPFVRTAFLP